jgi:hypothetical protein
MHSLDGIFSIGFVFILVVVFFEAFLAFFGEIILKWINNPCRSETKILSKGTLNL